jgi:hypothetical protein
MMLINLAFYSYAAYVEYSGSLIFTAVYRYEILPGAEGDPLIRRTREAVNITRKVLAPERAVHGVFASDRTPPPLIVGVGDHGYAFPYSPFNHAHPRCP